MTTIDGFRREDTRAFGGLSPAVSARFYSYVDRVARHLAVDVIGLENIPKQGAALIVGNHTFGWDVVFPMAVVWRELHRRVWTLGEHAWWRFPFLRRLAAAVGTVDGTCENADCLLDHGELVLVLPGGLRESVKPHELRYRLLWGHRYGFVRTAIKHGVPIVPLAAIGADDVFDLVGDAFARGQRWLHRTGIPIPKPAHFLPRRVPLRYIFGEPIAMRVPKEGAADPAVLHVVRHEVEGALHELIETELARRAGIVV